MIIDESANDENKTEWRSLCFAMNPQATKFIVQVTILSGLIVLSSVMLIKDSECNSQRNWSSLLMVCLGVFLPQPKFK